ncbi:hypothetical protein [Paenibacillus sp. Z6-24]
MWDWNAVLHNEQEALNDDGYSVYGKPAEQVIREFYNSLTE